MAETVATSSESRQDAGTGGPANWPECCVVCLVCGGGGEERGKREESERRGSSEEKRKRNVSLLLPFSLSLSCSVRHLRSRQRGPRRDQCDHRQGPGAPIGARRGRAGDAAPARQRRHSLVRSAAAIGTTPKQSMEREKEAERLCLFTASLLSFWPRDYADLRHRVEPDAQKCENGNGTCVCPTETTRARLVFPPFLPPFLLL